MKELHEDIPIKRAGKTQTQTRKFVLGPHKLADGRSPTRQKKMMKSCLSHYKIETDTCGFVLVFWRADGLQRR